MGQVLALQCFLQAYAPSSMRLEEGHKPPQAGTSQEVNFRSNGVCAGIAAPIRTQIV